MPNHPNCDRAICTMCIWTGRRFYLHAWQFHLHAVQLERSPSMGEKGVFHLHTVQMKWVTVLSARVPRYVRQTSHDGSICTRFLETFSNNHMTVLLRAVPRYICQKSLDSSICTLCRWFWRRFHLHIWQFRLHAWQFDLHTVQMKRCLCFWTRMDSSICTLCIWTWWRFHLHIWQFHLYNVQVGKQRFVNLTRQSQVYNTHMVFGFQMIAIQKPQPTSHWAVNPGPSA